RASRAAWAPVPPAPASAPANRRRRRRRRRPPLLSSPLPAAESPSYETWGDGNLLPETFAELYAPEGGAGGGGDEERSATATATAKPRLPRWLIDRAARLGFVHPTLLQRRALDVLLPRGGVGDERGEGGEEEEEEQDLPDVILHAQTGSGKTLAYLLPLLGEIDASRSAVQGLIVVPTRELGLQVVRVARRLGAGAVAVCSDDDVGQSIDGEIDEDDDEDDDDSNNDSNNDNNVGRRKIMIMPILQGSVNARQRSWAWAEPPHVVVGTPGELSKMVGRGGVRINSVRSVVVDEVDACLGKGGVDGATGNTGSGTLHELLSRHLSATYQEVDKVAASVEGSDGRVYRMSVAADDGERAAGGPQQSRPKRRRTIFASATIPQHNHFVRQCVRNGWTSREPVRVNVSPGEAVPPTLSHSYVVCRDKSTKVAGLRRWMRRELGDSSSSASSRGGGGAKVLVFCDPRRPLEALAEVVARDWNGIVRREGRTAEEDEQGHDAVVSVLRIEDSLGARAAAMEGFRGPDAGASANGERDGKLRVMLSTDLAARGLDVPNVSHVVNFDLPNDNEGDAYVHRGGRAGRLGARGKVVSLITADQEFVLDRLANKLSLDLKCVARQGDERKRRRRTKKEVT
ncbi:hypothetical protein ACHAWF_017088, partial [Thalassiosira exigua]